MNIGIFYGSTTGVTEQVAEKLGSLLILKVRWYEKNQQWKKTGIRSITYGLPAYDHSTSFCSRDK